MRSSRPPAGTVAKKCPIAAAPAMFGSGGIVSSASSRSSATRLSMSTAFHARTYRSSVSASAAADSGRWAGRSPRWSATVARARCSALLTAATLIPRASATSLADHESTSRNSSTARCRAGRT